jgi:hypothetical protein
VGENTVAIKKLGRNKKVENFVENRENTENREVFIPAKVTLPFGLLRNQRKMV